MDQTITIGGHATTQEIPTQPIIRNGTWKRNGNRLILERPDTPGPHEITVDILEDGNFMHLNTLMPPPVLVPGGSIEGLSGIILHVHLRRVN